MNKRYDELDSLRGLAACTVLFHHFLLSIPIIVAYTYGKQKFATLNLLKYSPLHIIWAGHEAVMLFFMLSGFVLSLPFLSQNVPYVPFLIKRIFRIYIPYLTAIAVAIGLKLLLYHHPIHELSGWFNKPWHLPLQSQQIWDHAILLKDFDAATLDPVVWSLTVEMRISILFPLLMVLVLRLGTFFSLIAALVLSYVGQTYHDPGHPFFGTDYVDTIHYASIFIFGILLAKNKDHLIAEFKKLPVFVKPFVLVAGILFYTYALWFRVGSKPFHVWAVDDWLISIGCAIFILSSMAFPMVSKLLLIKPIHYLGKISYSVYLYHCICLLASMHLLHSLLPVSLIFVIAGILTIAAASISYHYVEIPSIRLGRRLIPSANSKIPFLKTFFHSFP